jgi:hypothetical protein
MQPILLGCNLYGSKFCPLGSAQLEVELPSFAAGGLIRSPSIPSLRLCPLWSSSGGMAPVPTSQGRHQRHVHSARRPQQRPRQGEGWPPHAVLWPPHAGRHWRSDAAAAAGPPGPRRCPGRRPQRARARGPSSTCHMEVRRRWRRKRAGNGRGSSLAEAGRRAEEGPCSCCC